MLDELSDELFVNMLDGVESEAGRSCFLENPGPPVVQVLKTKVRIRPVENKTIDRRVEYKPP